MSCVGAFDCSAQSFHQSLPLSLRRAPLPPCLAHCNKAFALSLWCLCCFAAPLHCSPSVKARRRVSERMHPFHFTLTAAADGLAASSGYGASMLRGDYLYDLLSSPAGEYEPLFPWGFRNSCQGTSLMNLYCFHCRTNQSSITASFFSDIFIYRLPVLGGSRARVSFNKRRYKTSFKLPQSSKQQGRIFPLAFFLFSGSSRSFRN